MANTEKRWVRFYENCVNINRLRYWKRMRALIIYICVSKFLIPPKYTVSKIMGYLKGKSSLMIFEQFSNLKYKFGSCHFWCKGYFFSTADVNVARIIKYIREQETRDKIAAQHSLIEHKKPFMGSQEQWQKSGHACLSGQTSTGPCHGIWLFHVYSVMKRGPFSPVFRLLPLLLAGFMAQALYRPFPWNIKKASAISMRQPFYVSVRGHGRFDSAIC